MKDIYTLAEKHNKTSNKKLTPHEAYLYSAKPVIEKNFNIVKKEFLWLKAARTAGDYYTTTITKTILKTFTDKLTKVFQILESHD